MARGHHKADIGAAGSSIELLNIRSRLLAEHARIIVDRAALRGIGHRQGGRREQKHQRKQPGNPAFHQAFPLLSLIGSGLRAVVEQRGVAYARPARQQAAEAVHPLVIAGRSLVIGHG